MSLLQNIQRGFGFLWRMLDGARRIFFNLLFLVLIIFILVSLFVSEKKLQEKTVLILDLRGNVVEQESIGARQLLRLEVQGEKKYYAQLRDVIVVLDAAAKDPNISSMLLILDEMQNAGLPTLREIAEGIEHFKANNKKVIAWGSRFDQRQYFLAAHADEVYLHPMGLVALDGFGGYKNYYHDALEKLGITVNVMKVGTFKNFVEPFTANGPSHESLEAESYLYNGLWSTYLEDVEKARKLDAGSIMQSIDALPLQMQQVKGDLAKLALNNRLVDGLKTRDELREMMLKYGAKDEQIKSFRQINYDEYLVRQTTAFPANGDGVGVIIAEGNISDGNATAGSIGGLSTSALIRQAREDDQIKAVVLRINSPGGSAFGSELIRRELEITREAGKPVVVSMGDVAASGGYWMAMGADEIVADAATVTGSIGVFALLPTVDKALEKIGVHSGGAGTTWLRGAYDPTRAIDPRFAELVQLGVSHIYNEFITKAAEARNTTPEKINEVAQGRTWTGLQAKERGLVDTLGGYTHAIESAAARAKLGEHYAVHFIEVEPSSLDRFFKMIDVSLVDIMGEQFRLSALGGALNGLIGLNGLNGGIANSIPEGASKEIWNDARWLANMTDRRQPFSVMTHCMCRIL